MNKSKCSHCGAIVGKPAGAPATIHQKAGERSKCPGSGQPTTRI